MTRYLVDGLVDALAWLPFLALPVIFLILAGHWLRRRARIAKRSPYYGDSVKVRLFGVVVLVGIMLLLGAWLDAAVGSPSANAAAILAGVGVLIIVPLVTVMEIAAKKLENRDKDIAELAALLGFRYYPDGKGDDPIPVEVHRATEPLHSVPGTFPIRNLFCGARNDRQVFAFDHCRAFDSKVEAGRVSFQGRDAVSFVVIRGDCAFPRTHLRPAGLLASPGPKDADLEAVRFESAEFNRKWQVFCRNRRFAYDLVHPQVMEFLLERRGWSIELHDKSAVIFTGQAWNAPQFQEALKTLEGFLDLLRGYLLNVEGLEREFRT